MKNYLVLLGKLDKVEKRFKYLLKHIHRDGE